MYLYKEVFIDLFYLRVRHVTMLSEQKNTFLYTYKTITR